MSKKYLLIGFLFLIILVGAIETIDFNGEILENLTFFGNENVTKNVTISKDANITYAIMNISGLTLNTTICFQETANESTDCGGLSSGNYSEYDNWNDGNNATYSNIAKGENWYINYTKPTNSTSVNWSIYTKFLSYEETASIILPDICWEANNEKILLRLTGIDAGSLTHLQYSCYNGSQYYSLGQILGTDWVNEEYVYWTIENNTENPYIKINNTNIWSYVGQFNSTVSPNQTNDFSTILNTALNGGACDCTGCTLSGDNCTINFTFHSDTAGILQYSDINISWLEYTSPNLTINKPTGEYSTTQIPYNVSATDNWETDFCTYWVMRGASLEVANTTVTCSSEITGNLYVSSQNTDYVFHFFINDTSGNSNYSTSNFSTSENATIIIAPSSGGSGGAVIIDTSASWTMEAGGGIGSFDINLVRGTSQVREILFENIGSESRTLTLSCEDQENRGCKLVTFEEETVNLPLIQDLKTRADFKITAPETVELGKYVFNIVAKGDDGKENRVTVNLTIKETGFFSKLSSRTEGGTPYILIAIISFIVGVIGSSIILNKSKSKIKPIIIILISSSITYVAVLVI